MRLRVNLLVLLSMASIISPNFEWNDVVNSNYNTNHIMMKKDQFKEEKNDDFNYQFDVDHLYKGDDDLYETQDVYLDDKVNYYSLDEDGDKTLLERKDDNYLIAPISLDPNENNDSFSEASVVYRAGQDDGHYGNYVQWGATISQKKSGWWLWESTYIDKDFYSFDVTLTGTLQIEVTNIPSNCDYDLRVYRLSNNINTTCDDLNFDEYDYRSINAGNSDEKIVINNATPGTYYAVVYSYQDKYWNNDEAYLIKFQQVQNVTSNCYYDIEIGRKNNDLGAIWVSDFKPFGYAPTTISNSKARIYFHNYHKYPMIRNLFTRYRDEDLMYARIYVWDVATRAAIYEILNRILSTVESYDPWKDQQQQQFEVKINYSSLGVSVAGGVILVLQEAAVASAVVATLSALGAVATAASIGLAMAAVANMLNKNSPFDITKANLREYLINAKAGFEVGRGSNNEQVVMLKFRYHFANDGTDYIDYAPLYRNSEYNLYSDLSIDYIDPNSCINGTVNGIKTSDDLEEFLK